ncbi:MAG: DUF4097 family beta strand repeat-containing protein [Aureispira sp.]
MRSNYIKTLWSLCLLFCCITTSQAIGPKQTKEKTIKASYQVKANDLLELSNKYGNIMIENHQGNSIELEVKIKAWDGTAKKAQATLDRISIQREQHGRKVSLKTMIDHQDPNKVSLNSSKGFHINYVIKMPEDMSLELENKFGNVQIANVLGEVELEVKHGHLQAGILGKGDLEIKFGNADIERLNKSSSIEIKHGNLQVKKATKLEIKQAHGNLQLGEIEELEGMVEHGNISIEQVSKSIKWESEFGNFSLGKVKTTFRHVKIEVEHGNVRMNIDKAANFDFTATTTHGKINHNIPNLKIDKGHIEESAKGPVNGGGNAAVDIAVDFGNISLD